MKRFTTYFWKVVEAVMIVAFLVMILSVSVNVVLRYFGKALSWADEISSLAFVWMSFLGIAVGLRKGLHPAFNVVLEKANHKLHKVMLIFINLLIFVFLVYLLVGGYNFITRIAYQRTPIMGISVAWKYSALLFSTAIMLVETVLKFGTLFKGEAIRENEQTTISGGVA